MWRWIAVSIVVFGLILSNSPSALAGPPPTSSSVTVSATIGPDTGNIRLTGYASPNSLVTFLRSGLVAGTTVADSNSFFDKTFTGLTPGTYTFSIYGTDTAGRTTLTISFDTVVISGLTITLSGFLLPPTISIEKPILKRPDFQIADGAARNNQSVTAFFDNSNITKQVPSDTSGNWQAKVTDIFHLGTHSATALVQDSGGGQSNLTNAVPFTVVLSADLNVDNKVNLTDFSILMFNYARSGFPNKAADINDNGDVNLVDFSVMMFHWTGG